VPYFAGPVADERDAPLTRHAGQLLDAYEAG
jgi:hypothetical protein